MTYSPPKAWFYLQKQRDRVRALAAGGGSSTNAITLNGVLITLNAQPITKAA